LDVVLVEGAEEPWMDRSDQQVLERRVDVVRRIDDRDTDVCLLSGDVDVVDVLLPGFIERRVDAEQYQIFDFYVLKGWPVLKVSKTFGVSAPHVYLVKHRIAKLIKKELQNLEAKAW